MPRHTAGGRAAGMLWGFSPQGRPMPTPATGFSVFSGTSGDFQVVTLAQTTGFDIVTVPGTPPTPVSVLELSKWRFTDTVTGAEFVGFGSTADALLVLGKIPLVGGISDWTVDLEGAYNGNSSSGLDTYSRLKRGLHVYFNLIYHKVSGLGYRGCVGKITEFGGGPDVESNKATPVSIKIKGQNILPAPTFSA